MGFPSKLKNMNFFIDGEGCLGVISEVTLPKLAIKMDEWRGGGMIGPLMIDQGLEKMELEYKLGGLLRAAMKSFGITTHAGLLTRFAGAYQDDDSGEVVALEGAIMGRYSEIDLGTAKVAGDTEHGYKVAVSYFRLEVDGEEWLEVDMLAGIFKVFGEDRYADIRAAIGA